MIKVKFFGVGRLEVGKTPFEVEAKTIKELIAVMAKTQEKYKEADLKKFLVYINEVPIKKLKMYRSALKDGDVVMFMSPASGG
ncbi:MAG: MoaD/ThiS family protein [Clostridia bacterium]